MTDSIYCTLKDPLHQIFDSATFASLDDAALWAEQRCGTGTYYLKAQYANGDTCILVFVDGAED